MLGPRSPTLSSVRAPGEPGCPSGRGTRVSWGTHPARERGRSSVLAAGRWRPAPGTVSTGVTALFSAELALTGAVRSEHLRRHRRWSCCERPDGRATSADLRRSTSRSRRRTGLLALGVDDRSAPRGRAAAARGPPDEERRDRGCRDRWESPPPGSSLVSSTALRRSSHWLPWSEATLCSRRAVRARDPLASSPTEPLLFAVIGGLATLTLGASAMLVRAPCPPDRLRAIPAVEPHLRRR